MCILLQLKRKKKNRREVKPRKVLFVKDTCPVVTFLSTDLVQSVKHGNLINVC